mmetsp:Transcript_8162/g.20536  ORF Transcript_8162/g.20536 Transcript_8162/m.20536 type:complete len:86 (+) Transcript_8162:2849-3106(+)
MSCVFTVDTPDDAPNGEGWAFVERNKSSKFRASFSFHINQSINNAHTSHHARHTHRIHAHTSHTTHHTSHPSKLKTKCKESKYKS